MHIMQILYFTIPNYTDDTKRKTPLQKQCKGVSSRILYNMNRIFRREAGVIVIDLLEVVAKGRQNRLDLGESKLKIRFRSTV